MLHVTHTYCPSEEQDTFLALSAEKHSLQIVLIDVHALIRLALQRFVDALPSMRVVASFSTIHDALAIMDWTKVHTVVLGTSVSVTDCLDFVTQLNAKQLPSGIILIQHYLYPETVVTLIKKGVHSLLDESATEEDMVNAIATASAGNIFLNKRTRDLFAISLSGTPVSFTARELQVLSLLKAGESNLRIAQMLGLREKTVEKYLTHIYSKLNVDSRAKAILSIQQLNI